MIPKNGCLVHEGRSLYDGNEAVAIATGFKKTDNDKLGYNTVQIWVLKADKKPNIALKDRSSKTVCGDCPLQHKICYVRPTTLGTIHKKYRGEFKYPYPPITDDYLEWMHKRKKVLRLTAYGEAIIFPYYVFAPLIDAAHHTLGYTHQWRSRLGKPWKGILQASVHSEREAISAQDLGWKTFRIKLPEEPLLPGEILCPHSLDPAIQCQNCKLCDGKSANIAIGVHGLNWKPKNFRKLKGRSGVD